ncbi:MAG: hypothetical protein ACTSRP_02265 [Candidatus Helarchaeota archaeon]
MADLNQDLYMIIFKVIEVIIYFYCGYSIYRKNKEYILNRTYFISFLGWAAYIILDAILFPIGHIETGSFGNVTTKYGIATIPIIANVLRDIAVFAGAIIAFGFLYASIIIRYGEAKAKERNTLILLGAGYILMSVLTAIFDQIIKEINKVPETVHTQFSIPSAIMIVAQIVIYFLGIYELAIIYRKTSEKKEKRRIFYFIMGATFIALGVLFFVVVGLVGTEGIAYITGPIGHIIWILAPIFILLGIRKSK